MRLAPCRSPLGSPALMNNRIRSILHWGKNETAIQAISARSKLPGTRAIEQVVLYSFDTQSHVCNYLGEHEPKLKKQQD